MDNSDLMELEAMQAKTCKPREAQVQSFLAHGFPPDPEEPIMILSSDEEEKQSLGSRLQQIRPSRSQRLTLPLPPAPTTNPSDTLNVKANNPTFLANPLPHYLTANPVAVRTVKTANKFITSSLGPQGTLQPANQLAQASLKHRTTSAPQPANHLPAPSKRYLSVNRTGPDDKDLKLFAVPSAQPDAKLNAQPDAHVPLPENLNETPNRIKSSEAFGDPTLSLALNWNPAFPKGHP